MRPAGREARERRLARGLALLGTALFAACGWRAGLRPPSGGSTVGVEVFGTSELVLERNLEPRLADALSRAVSDLVQAPLAAPAEADLVVRGTILDYRHRSGIRDRKNRQQETGVLVSVTAELVDRRAGRVLVPASSPRVWSGFTLGDRGTENEARASDRALDYLARTLVLDLFGPETRAPDPPAVASPADAKDEAPL